MAIALICMTSCSVNGYKGDLQWRSDQVIIQFNHTTFPSLIHDGHIGMSSMTISISNPNGEPMALLTATIIVHVVHPAFSFVM